MSFHFLLFEKRLEGRDGFLVYRRRNLQISTHTSLAGRDQDLTLIVRSLKRFLLTRPSRDVTTLDLM